MSDQSFFQTHWKNERVRVAAELMRLFQYWNNIYKNGLIDNRAFFQGLWNYIVNSQSRKVLKYFLTNGAASAKILSIRTGLSNSTVYWNLNKMENLGLIERGVKVQMPHKKRQVTIHCLPGTDKAILQEAARLHARLLYPNYRMAEDLAQLVLEEFMEMGAPVEIAYSELIQRAKAETQSQAPVDVAAIAAQIIHNKGGQVWR